MLRFTRRLRSLIAPLMALALATAASGCPDLPDFGAGDTAMDVGDTGETFVPLSLDRVVASVGEPSGFERVTIFGDGFQPGAEVFFDGEPGDNVLVLDAQRINVNTPPHDPGLVDVRVRLADGQNEQLGNAFLYRSPLAVDTISPRQGPITGGIPIVVSGADFGPGTRVFIGDRQLEAAEADSSQTITGVLPAQPAGRVGLVDVVVSDGFEQRVLPRAFRYVGELDIQWLSPATGPSGGGTEVVIHGSGLEADTVVSVGDTVAETVVPGQGTMMTIRTPPGDHGPADVVAVNALESKRLADAYLYVDEAQRPAGAWLGNAWPGFGPAAGGTQVALSVYGLSTIDDLVVTFGDAQATVIDPRLADDILVVSTPANAPGPVTVTVSAGGRSTSRAGLYEYRVDLEVDELVPDFGPTAGGTLIEARGEGFTEAASVQVGGKEARVAEVNDDVVYFHAPPGVAGRVDVRIVDGARQTTLPGGYEYRSAAATKIWAITPGTGAQSGGRIVRILGEGLHGKQPALNFSGADLDDVQVVDDGMMIARAPRGDVGSVNVNAHTFGRLAMAYEYFDPRNRFGGTDGGNIPEALNITVLDAVTGEGVEEAFVILWDDLDSPYQDVTDDRGQLTFSGVGFGPLQMVTASKDNYTTASIVDFDARDATLLLIPLVSAPPGGGNGPGPTTLPDSVMSGKVSGMDKYIVLPPGNCDNKTIVGANDTLCGRCETHDDCAGEDSRCTNLGDQGDRCTIACGPSDACPEGFVCQGVGDGALQCVPAPGDKTARCSVTQPDVFTSPEGPTPLAFTDPQGLYQLESRPGEYAIVCTGGYLDPDTGEFIPLMMGVRRHVFALPGETVAQQDVRLDIPLTRDLRVRLDDAPIGRTLTRKHTVDIFLDLGADGVYHMPSAGEGLDQNEFFLKHFPERFAESLYDSSYTIYATAVRDLPDEEQNGEGSFVLLQDVTEIDDDSIFEIVEEGAASNRTGIINDIYAMHGDGTERIWAVGSDGQVLVWDGTWWGLQQTPTDVTLRGVWAGEGDVWAVGDEGAVVRWDGLRWNRVEMPPAIEDVDWRGVHAVGGEIWMWGSAGVWRHDGITATQVILDVMTGAVMDVWSDGGPDAWLVGANGLIRHWQAGTVVNWDSPGSSLRAIHGEGEGVLWAVGDGGRIMRFDGSVWFDFLPITSRSLRAVHARGNDSVWVAGDAGMLLRWDGSGAWRVHAEVDHADLRGIWTTSEDRTLAAGLHTVVVGPFLRLPQALNPNLNGNLTSLDIRWSLDPGADASFTFAQLLHNSGFPFWSVMSEGGRRNLPLPDLKAAWGLEALWPGPGFLQLVRVYAPGFDINRWDQTILNEFEWQSWAVAGFSMIIPE